MATTHTCRAAMAALLFTLALCGCGGGGGPASSSSSPSSSPSKPGPSNTGVPAGTVLTPSGSLDLTTPGQVIDALDITGCVNVKAPNVTIRRTRIRCDSYYPVWVQDGASLLIEDSEIDGTSARGDATSGIAFSNYVARRVNIHGTADGAKADDNVLLEDSWIHDLYLGPGDHADGVQSTGNGGSVTIRHNFIDIVDHGLGHGGGPNSCFQVGTEHGSNANWTIQDNWLYGGGWVVHVDAGSGHGNVIVDNRIGRGTAQVAGQPDYPEYGPFDTLGDWSASGNVWDDDSTAITP